MLDAGDAARRQYGVQARQPVEGTAQGVTVARVVQGAVERPATARHRREEGVDRGQVQSSLRGEEAEYEGIGTRRPEPRGRFAEPVQVCRLESVALPQHDPQGDGDGLADAEEVGQ